MDEIAEAGRRLTHQLIDSPDYMKLSDAAIPDRYRVPNDNPRPNFMTVDFGFVRMEDGSIQPKLVELQAFPSVFGYQEILSQEYQSVYGLDESLVWRFNGMSEADYWDLLRRTIVGMITRLKMSSSPKLSPNPEDPSRLRRLRRPSSASPRSISPACASRAISC